METYTKRDSSMSISRQIVEQAQDGDAWTQYQLANYLYVGDGIKEPDKEQGFRWMQASAENGCIKAQKVLGLLYMNGQHSPWPERDLEKAVVWYERAAELGDAEAMYWLSCCYRKGVGVLYDKARADYWEDKARENGYETGDTDEKKSEGAASSERPWEQYDLEEEGNSQRAASSKKKKKRSHARELKEKSLDIAQEGVIFTPKHDIEYVKGALVYGVIAFSIGVILCCLTAVLINAFFPDFFASDKREIFLIAGAGVSLLLGIIAFRNGYLSAYEEAKRSAWFRKTPFYRQYHVDYDRLSVHELQEYGYYTALEKSFKPCSYQDPIPRGAFREFRGYMFMGLFFGKRGAAACPDFVIITEKSVYVIQCLNQDGKLRGSIDDTEWFLTTESGRGRMIPNPLLQNDRRIQIIKKDCSVICPWAVTDEVPFYSIVLAGPDTDIRAVEGLKRSGKACLLKVSGEELRSHIEVMESKNTLKEEETAELAKAFEQIAGEYTKRRTTLGKEAI